MKTPHNESMLALRDGVLFVLFRSETGHQCLDKFVLQSTRSLGVRDDLRRLPGERHGGRMQPQQPRHRCWRRRLRHHVSRRFEIVPGCRRADSCERIHRQRD